MADVEFKFEGSFDRLQRQLETHEKNVRNLEAATESFGNAQARAFGKAENAQKSATSEQRKAGQETERHLGLVERLEREYSDLGVKIKQATNPADLKKFRAEQQKVVDGLKDLQKSTEPLANLGDDVKGGFSGVGGFLSAQLLPLAGVAASAEVARQVFQQVLDISKEVNTATGFASQLTGESGDSLDSLVARGRALANVYDEDYREVLIAANTVANEFGITQAEALDQIERGFVSGANANGDFLDLLKEYPAQFANASGSAQQFIDTTIQAQQEGIFSDKGVDAVKEFNLRVREQTTATSDAIKNLLGEEAGEELLAGVRDGSISSIDALKLVSDGLNDTSVSADVLQTAVADVFGGAGEDAGVRYLQNLGAALDGQVELNAEAEAFAEKQRRQIELQTELANVEGQLAEAVGGTGASLEGIGTQLQIFGTELLVDIVNLISETKGSFDELLEVGKPIFDLYVEGLRSIGEFLGFANDETVDWSALLVDVLFGSINRVAKGLAQWIDIIITFGKIAKENTLAAFEFIKAVVNNTVNDIKAGFNGIIDVVNNLPGVDIERFTVGSPADVSKITDRFKNIQNLYQEFGERAGERWKFGFLGESEEVEDELSSIENQGGQDNNNNDNDNNDTPRGLQRLRSEIDELERLGAQTIEPEINIEPKLQSGDQLNEFFDDLNIQNLEEDFLRLQDASAEFGTTLENIAGIQGISPLFESLATLFSTELPEGVSKSQAALNAAAAGVGVLAQAFSNFASQRIAEQQAFIQGLDEQISEQESAIDEEKALQEEGLANSVASEEEKLAQLQAQREDARAEQEKLQKQQIIADGIAQASALATAAAQVFAAEGTKGIVGILTAAGAITSLLATFTSFKAKAKSASVVAREGYSDTIDGKLHTQGGEDLGYINAERGELISILTRPATRKHGKKFKKLALALNKGFDFESLTSPIIASGDIDQMASPVFNFRGASMKGVESRLDTIHKEQKKAPQVTDYGDRVVTRIGNTTTITRKR